MCPINKRDSSPISIVPDDLLAELFLRLPNARSATRCAAVCRPWRHLISDHLFGHKFIQRHHDQTHLPYTIMLFLFDDKLFYQIFSDESKTLHGRAKLFSDSFRYLNFLPNHVDALACSGDLLLVSSPSPSCHRTPPATEYRLCNPLSRRWIALPAVAASQDHAVVKTRHGLACEPTIVIDESDRIRFRFRVVKLDRFCIDGNNNDNDNVFGYGLTMFCSEIGEWRRSTIVAAPAATARRGTKFCSSDAIAMGDGVLHFALGASNPEHGGDAFFGFLTIDPFSDEEANCCFIARPEGLFHGRSTWFAGAVRGRLRLSQCSSGAVQNGAFRLRIWELSYDSGGSASASWGSVYDGEVKASVRNGRMMVIGFDPNNGDVIFLLKKCLSEIIRFKLEDQDCEILGQIPPEPMRNCLKEGFGVYLRSFMLVHPAWPTPIPGI